MRLDAILHQLDQVYDLALGVDIHDFMLTSEMCDELGHDRSRASVLLRQGNESGNELELGVYLGESTLETLKGIDLASTIEAKSLDALFTSIEEVSHFAYLLFSAQREKRVSQLELELQGEVDKFITAALLIAAPNGGRVPRGLLDRLFSGFELRAELDAPTRARYHKASSLASRYCSYVLEDALGRRRLGPLLSELRSFYRLTQRGKIGRIHRVVYDS